MADEQTKTIIPAPLHDAKDVEENKDLAALSYFWILSVIVYFIKKDSPFIRFHARQAIALFVLSIVFWFVPFVAKFLELLILGFAALGFIRAAQGEWKELPLIGPMSRFDVAGLRSHWRSVISSVAHHWKKAPHPPSPVDKTPPAGQHSPDSAAVAPTPPTQNI